MTEQEFEKWCIKRGCEVMHRDRLTIVRQQWNNHYTISIDGINGVSGSGYSLIDAFEILNVALKVCCKYISQELTKDYKEPQYLN